jgi:enamine deaminase RidA (YjgF/YER057c/UK114 family)
MLSVFVIHNGLPIMDPLSITAGVIAVGTLTAQVSKAFSHLRKVCKELLDRLHALGNDVTDLSAVIKDVDAIATDPAANVAPADQTSISVTLGSLQSKLPELKEIIHNLSNACEQTRVPLIKARQWSKAQVKLQRLQEEIKTHKSHLNIALSASNS